MKPPALILVGAGLGLGIAALLRLANEPTRRYVGDDAHAGDRIFVPVTKLPAVQGLPLPADAYAVIQVQSETPDAITGRIQSFGGADLPVGSLAPVTVARIAIDTVVRKT